MNTAKIAIATNIVFLALIVFSSVSIMITIDNVRATTPIVSMRYTPFQIEYFKQTISNGQLVTAGAIYVIWNTPFLLFIIAIAVNIYFFVRLQESKDDRYNRSNQ